MHLLKRFSVALVLPLALGTSAKAQLSSFTGATYGEVEDNTRRSVILTQKHSKGPKHSPKPPKHHPPKPPKPPKPPHPPKPTPPPPPPPSSTGGPVTTGPSSSDTSFPTTGPATTGPSTSDTSFPTTGPATTGPSTSDTSFPTTGPETTGPATTGPATTGPSTSDTSFPTTAGDATTAGTTTGKPETDTSFPTTGETTAGTTGGGTDTSFPTTGETTAGTTGGGTDTSFPTTGETTAGTTTAGETTAGETTAGTTAGETTSGGTTTTTGETTAGTTTGETTTTTGDESTTTGDEGTTGEETGSTEESTGDQASSGSTESPKKEKEKLKHKWEPLFYLDFDFAAYLINLTPHRGAQQRPPPAPAPAAGPLLVTYAKTRTAPVNVADTLVMDDHRGGFQKATGGTVSAGVGAQVKWWYANSSGIKQDLWAYVGILPVVGTSTYSKRYVKTLEEAQSASGYTRSPSARDIEAWQLGDSVKSVNSGGVVFMAGLGLNPVGVGAAGFAAGTWEKYIEKVSETEAYVKISKGKLNKLALFTYAGIMSLQTEKFNSTDDGFSFVYDLSLEEGRRAFEDMTHGNILASEQIAARNPANHVERAPLTKIETFRTISTGALASLNLGIPILWNYSSASGNIKSFTSSQLYVDRNTAQAHYGVYTQEKSNRLFFRHTEQALNFYGTRYTMTDWETNEVAKGVFGQYQYSYHKDHSSARTFTAAVDKLVKKTGVDFLRVKVPASGHLGYAGFALSVKLSEENTMNMIREAQTIDRASFVSRAVSPIRHYVKVQKDPYDLCPKAEDTEAPPRYEAPDCEKYLSAETAKAATQMYVSLRNMNKYLNQNDSAFSIAYGEFGEGMAANMFAFRYATRIAGPDLLMSYLVQGTRFSLYAKEWVTDEQGQWWPVTYSGDRKPVDPRFIHSDFRRDLLTNNNR